MKGLVFDIRSFSVHDGPGIRTTVFLKGCALRCSWCHNPESQRCMVETVRKFRRFGSEVSETTETLGTFLEASAILKRFEADRPFFEESNGGITLSGGEPLLQPAFTLFLLKASKELGIHTAIDTSGYASTEIFKNIIQAADLVLYDLKLADDYQHQHYTGQSNQLILENLRYLKSIQKRFFIRIPLIPDVTDTQKNLEGLYEIIEELKEVERIDLLPFHHLGKTKYERMGKIFDFQQTGPYNSAKSEQIKSFFLPLAKTVSIGG